MSKLEHLLHVFFAPAQLAVEVVGEGGRTHTPKEWFDLPLAVVGEAVQLLVNGDILRYRYDPDVRRIVRK